MRSSERSATPVLQPADSGLSFATDVSAALATGGLPQMRYAGAVGNASMRPLKIVGIALAALVAVLILAALAIVLLVNPNDYRADIERLTAQKTGRELRLAGPLSLKLFPWLALSASDVQLGNPQGFGPEPFLTVRNASIGVKLFPLLRKRIEVTRVAVEGLRVNLISRGPKDSPVTNWQDLVSKKSQQSQPAGSSSPLAASIGAVDVRSSSLVYRDETVKSTTALTNLQLHSGPLGVGGAVPTTVSFDYAAGAGKPVMHIALKANVQTPPDFRTLRLSDLDLALNDTHIRGSLAVEDLKSLGVKFDLQAADLDLDRLFPSTNTSAAAAAAPPAQREPTALPVEALRKLDAQGTLRIGTLTVKRLVFSGVVLPVAAKNGRVHLGPTHAGLFGGRFDGDISIDARPALAQVSLNEHIKGVDIGAAMKALYGTTRVIGRGDANAALSGTGNTDTAILGSLNGKLDVNVKNGAIDGVDLWYELRRARALLKQQAPPARSGPERTPFNMLTATGTVESGVMRNDDLRIETDYLKASGRGTLDLKTEAIDYRLTAQLYKLPPEGTAGSELADLKAGEIPISITGSLANLKVRPDIETLARQEVKGKLQQKTDELKQKLGDKLRDLLGH